MPRIDKNTVDKIYDAVRIEEIVGDYVSLKRRGTNMMGLCPFHDEKTPSFTVSPAKGIYKCFGCGKGGNAINFIMEIEQISYYEALKQVAEKYHIHIEEKELSPEDEKQFTDRDGMMVLNEFARKYFSDQLLRTDEGRSVGLSYFKQRAFSDQTIEKFQLGYSPEGKDIFTNECLNKGYKEEYINKTGLATIKPDYKRDRYAGRVIFPIHNQSGKVVAFAGRTLTTDKSVAKYINSPESEVYHKSNILYGIYHAKKQIQRKDNCFLVEGYTDVMSLHQSGIENVVASSGTSLTQGQIRLIKRFTENITVIYDGDNAGIKASLRGIDMILSEGLNVKTLLLPDGEDPDSFAKSMGASELMDYIEKNCTDFIHFKTNLLIADAENDPIKMAKLIQEIVGSIAVIPNEITRTVYIKSCSNILEVAEDTLWRECNKIINHKNQDKHKEQERRISRERYEKRQAAQNNPNTPPDNLFLPHDADVPPQTPASQSVKDKPEERMVMTFLIRYGEMKMFKEGDLYYDEYPDMTVSDFIINELDVDELRMNNPLFNFIVDEYRQLKEDGDKNPERHFTHHQDPKISQTAVDLTAERHELSKMYEARSIDDNEHQLATLVPRIMTEFKLQWVIEQIKEQMEILKTETDEEKLNEATITYKELNKVKSELSKILGNRIVLI